MLGGVVKDKAMGRIAEKGSTGRHGCEDARLTFNSQVDIQVGLLSHIADERCGLMGVEVVDDEMPLHDVGSRVNGALDMSEKVFLVTGGASRDLPDPAIRDVEVDDEGQRAVPDVLELPTQDPSGLHGQVGVLGFQGLYASHFIRAHGRFSTLSPFLSGLIQLIDVGNFLVRLRIGCSVQIVAHQVRLECPPLTAAPHGEAR
jgi:hypothetical protein